MLLFYLILGLVMLGLGGELLVKGASQLARQLGVSALVVGLTVVAFGTSSPEVAVTMLAGGRGEDTLAVANVVGSCTMNILIVLGLAALASPMKVSRSVIKIDAPIMIAVLALFLLFASDDGELKRWMGLFFLGSLSAYMLFTVLHARREPRIISEEFESGLGGKGKTLINIGLLAAGLGALVLGADFVIKGAVGIAEYFQISKRIIGLTIVALGTSLPEVVTCVIAARRNQPDIAIGNVIGSNIFNILAVLGCTATCYPLSVSQHTIFVDGPVMLGAAVLSIYLLRTGHRISRMEGGVLVSLYGCYLFSLIVIR